MTVRMSGKRVVSLPVPHPQEGGIKMGRASSLSKDEASPIQTLVTGSQVMKRGPGSALQVAEAMKKKSSACHAHLCVRMGVGATTRTCALRDVPCLLL